ncbi:MAG: lysine--tRNA ligase [Nanoarchaeota archaeon]|nr:lysine--tRNA ligase [Nanoarchaeota archaeon]
MQKNSDVKMEKDKNDKKDNLGKSNKQNQKGPEGKDFEGLFWADQLASEIIARKKFHYLDRPIHKFDTFTVKTSASLSGILHIGRLSDTIRGASVARALKDAGVKSKLLWVAEDMDPLRKIPKNVPANFEKYLGTPVSAVPDPDGCHKSYAEHFMAEYFKVLDEFVFMDMEKLSTKKAYEDGSFKPHIKVIMDNLDKIIEIQNKFRDKDNKLSSSWSPWAPICENCGKIITAKITEFDHKNELLKYHCQDYSFETTTAKGCGHKGENNPLKDKGKLMWKSEWAAQWAMWKICAEGAGKEYQVPNSAFWINAEICEKVLEFPHPEPIFYEHIMIDNVKMSASLGNVVYPNQWLDVAPAEILRFFYNKRLMKTRSFSWKDLPKFYEEFDSYGEVYFGTKKVDNEKESTHMRRLYEISNNPDSEQIRKPLLMTFSHAVILAQIYSDDEDIIQSLIRTGHFQDGREKEVIERLNAARSWLKSYAPDEVKFEVQTKISKIDLKDEERLTIHQVSEMLRRQEFNEKSLHEEFYNICKANNIQTSDFFRICYQILFKKDRGPRLAHFILTYGKDKVAELFEKV